jgi:hypothetical protein
VAASQDAEDTLEVAGVGNKVFLLAEQGTTDNQITLRLGSGAAQNTVILTGYERLQDAASNDVYDMQVLASVLAGLTLTDNGAQDHDAIKVRNDAVNFNGAGANTISLESLSTNAGGGFGFDFDVLDITGVTANNLILTGGTNAAPANADGDTTDEVVLGALSRVTTITNFEAVVLTEASVTAGSTFTFNAGTGVLSQGSTNVTLGTTAISFGGLIREVPTVGGIAQYGQSYVADVTTGVTVTVSNGGAEIHGGAGADTLIGAGGNDTFRGGAGNDTLDGGIGTETRTVQVAGIMGGGTADGTVAVVLNGNTVVTFTEAAGVNTLGDNFGSVALGNAVVSFINNNLAAVNTAAAWTGGAALAGASFNQNNGLITFTFVSGINANNAEAIALNVNLGTDAGTLAASAQSVVSEGSDGGVNTFIFAPTAAANGQDTINNFKNAATDDNLIVDAFLGAAPTFAGVANFVAAGLAVGNGQVGVVFNKASLTAADVQLAAAAGKISVPDNGKAVVLVTADADGTADATNNPYLMYYIQDTDADLGAGEQSYTVTLVATINSATELTAANWTIDNFT